jgi:hypothetical protein
LVLGAIFGVCSFSSAAASCGADWRCGQLARLRAVVVLVVSTVLRENSLYVVFVVNTVLLVPVQRLYGMEAFGAATSKLLLQVIMPG